MQQSILGPAKKQAEKQYPAAIASVIFQALISLIKLNLNALIGQYSEKCEIWILKLN